MGAYESGKIKGKKVSAIRRLRGLRAGRHKRVKDRGLGLKNDARRPTADDLLRVYQREAEKQRLLARKAEFAQARLLFIVEALKDLLADEGFVTLLRAEGLTALVQLGGRDFEVLVSAVICADEAELRRQFVLVNNTRPLPKSLIYELLPGIDGLPSRLPNRAFASELTAGLNYDPASFLQGEIYQHTNPGGRIKDTAIQRVIMNSLSDGMMREFLRAGADGAGEDQCFDLISEFYRAVAMVFPDAWAPKHTPKSSRLVHGAGIVALGYVMEVLALLDGARSSTEFAHGLGCLVGRTAWTSGEWDFGDGDRRNWRAIQNVNRDIVTLAQHLIGIVRADIRARRSAQQGSREELMAVGA